MARLIDADAIKEAVRNYTKGTALYTMNSELFRILDNMTPVDAIPVDWLERRLNETAEATARGDDQTELNNAIFTVLVDWEKGRLKNGKA